MSAFNTTVEVPPGFKRLVGNLSSFKQASILEEVGRDVAVNLARYFSERSKTRHKTAANLGVEPTGILEFSEFYPPTSRGGASIDAYRRGTKDVFVVVHGIPFLGRAFGEVHIRPKRASALTIPISGISARHSASEMKTLGWVLFTKRGDRGASGILFGKRGEDVVPLYRLVKSAILPRDSKLLPSSSMVGRWAEKSVRRQLRAK